MSCSITGVVWNRTTIWDTGYHTYVPAFAYSLQYYSQEQDWKQHKCPSMDEWIKMWYIHNKILFRPGEEGNPVICDNMDEACGHYAKWKTAWCYLNVESRKAKLIKNEYDDDYWGWGWGKWGDVNWRVQTPS